MTNAVYLNLDGSIGQDITDLGNSFVSVTISGGGITFGGTLMSVDTEGSAATDDLETIANGGTGKLLLLRSQSAARAVTLKHDSGNLWSAAGDITLTDPNQLAMLIYNGSKWVIMSVMGGGTPDLSLGCTASETLLVDCRSGATATGSIITQTGKYYRLTVSGEGLIHNSSPPVYHYADAFFSSFGGWGSPTAQNGFQINGSYPTGQSYKPDHVYQLTLPGTGAAFTFRFVDDPYTDNSNWALTVVLCQLD